MILVDDGIFGNRVALFRLLHVGFQVQEALDPGGLKEFVKELQHLHKFLFGLAWDFTEFKR